jgi:hypothetical protein
MNKPVYRSIFLQAWQTAWGHKKLWLLGVLAGILNTGGVIDVLFTAFKRTQTVVLGPDLVAGFFRESIPGAETLATFAQKTAQTSDTRVLWTVLILSALGIIGLYLAVAAQDALIHAIKAAKPGRKLHLPNLFRHGHHVLAHLFTINILGRLAMSVTIAITGLLFAAVASTDTAKNALGDAAILLLFVPATLLVSYLSIYAIVETSLKEKPVFTSIMDAWHALKRHLLSLTEVAILLFAANLVISAAMILAILLFAVPYLLIFTGTLFLASGPLWVGVTLAGTIGVFLIIIAFMGFGTVFTYAVWVGTYQKFSGRTTILSKLHRIFS